MLLLLLSSPLLLFLSSSTYSVHVDWMSPATMHRERPSVRAGTQAPFPAATSVTSCPFAGMDCRPRLICAHCVLPASCGLHASSTTHFEMCLQPYHYGGAAFTGDPVARALLLCKAGKLLAGEWVGNNGRVGEVTPPAPHHALSL